MSSALTHNPELITPIAPKHHWRFFTDEELGRLADATYRILEEVGVQFPLPAALQIFADHGAEVDWETQIVRPNRELVEKALASAPRYFSVGGREAAYDFSLQPGRTFYATDGCMPFVVDLETRQKRHSRKADVAMMARMADYLNPIAFYWPMVSAADHGETAPLHEIHASYLNCRKHVQTETAMGRAIATYAREMALVISGNSETMRRRPPLSALICCIDPLGQDQEGLETGLIFAGAGLPVGFMAMNTLMSTGPATAAGALAVANAEVISALTMIQLAYPGAPVFHSMPLAVMEPRTGGYLFHSPLGDTMFGAAVELAHHFNLPSLGSFGGSDALQPGWRSAKEGHAGLFSALAGAEWVVGVGGMAAASTLYPENLILDCDIYHDHLITAAGIEVNDETLALDVIRRVGPRGNYLMEDHTLRHLRRLPFSDLILETSKNGRGGPQAEVESAREKARWILNNHRPDPPDEVTQAEMQRILAAADHEIKGGRVRPGKELA
jgi:trimethylamine--corrinoid protein Co-methyltransferase